MNETDDYKVIKKNVNNFHKGFACASFLIISLIWVTFLHSDWRFLTQLILFIPQLFCADWLLRNYKTNLSRFSTECAGFSILRILYGTVIATILLLLVLFLYEVS